MKECREEEKMFSYEEEEIQCGSWKEIQVLREFHLCERLEQNFPEGKGKIEIY